LDFSAQRGRPRLRHRSRSFIQHESHGHELAAVLHRGDHVAHAEHQLRAFLADLLREAAGAGGIRDDIAVDELANYALHALASAGSLPSKAAVRRLVGVTLDGLQPRH